MQRIPNPVSDPEIFMRVFCDVYEVLSHLADFGLDDISRAMIERNNVTSQGAIGAEALRRSTRVDRSRDPIYNQSKMYAELFRTLGWIQSLANARLRYAFSRLGDHMAVAQNRTPLMRESLLGIAYPNEVLGVQSDQTVRVIGGIILTLDALGTLSRDEMIAGPMSIADDTNPTEFTSMLQRLRNCRRTAGALDAWIEEISTRRRITRHPTMENYTRIPIGMMAWSGWSTKQRGVLTITDEGRLIAARLRRSPDMRLSDFNSLPDAAKPAFIRWTFYKMLERAGFNVELVHDIIEASANTLTASGIPHEVDIYFSPFQQLSRETLSTWTPELVTTPSTIGGEASVSLVEAMADASQPVVRERTALIFELSEHAASMASSTEELVEEIQSVLARTHSIDETADALLVAYSQVNRDVFYPLVANLFCIIGFNCRISRGGQNYERADAMILDPTRSIPIEIKSPGEETEISVKAVRQALENKIVLLSRESYPTDRETTSLVVGFNPPNDRSEVHDLVVDIYNTFNIRVGVIDFKSLLILAINTVFSGRQIRMSDFYQLQGAIRVECITPTR